MISISPNIGLPDNSRTGLTMRRQTVKAFVHRGHNDRDHFAFQFAEPAVGQHRFVIKRGERIQFVDVKRMRNQNIWNHSQFFLANIKIFLCLFRKG
jgi:hypothetical protein